ncbi:hypothetical protein D3C81_2005650 [compost metagenome]
MVFVLEAAQPGHLLDWLTSTGEQQRGPLQPQPLQQRHGRQREVLLAEAIELTLGEVQGPGHPADVPALAERLFQQQLEAQGQPLATFLSLPFLQQAAQIEAELLHQQRAE